MHCRLLCLLALVGAGHAGTKVTIHEVTAVHISVFVLFVVFTLIILVPIVFAFLKACMRYRVGRISPTKLLTARPRAR
jgi:hypothetical protein